MVWPDLKTYTLLIIALFGIGGVSGLLLGGLYQRLGTRLALACALAAGLLSAYSAVGFWQPAPQRWSMAGALVPALAGGFPVLRLEFFVDRLATFFILLTGLLSAGVALYSFVWLEGKPDRHRIAGVFNVFVLFTLLLLVVNNVYFFLVCLECMTLAFGYLTLYRHNTLLEQPAHEVAPREMADAKRAFKVYLIFSHVGVIFIAAALILLALPTGALSFDALRGSRVAPAVADTVFLLALIGFGIKGGFVFAHPWVTIVHPYSPTTTHALTLGLIIKVSSFYLLIRVLFEFLAPAAAWWGWLVLVLAGLTALVGVFYAITSRDLKTALANHSVENIGIILAGLGLALLLSAYDPLSPLAVLALVASLYHLLNHTVFKGLLYLCTGAIENRTGTVRLDELGGLIQRFPVTAATFLVGTAAIAGFPPLNGFISEWLTLQAIFASLKSGVHNPSWVVAGLFGALLMLGAAFGLTALAFVKIAGEALLGAPRLARVPDEEQRGDVPWPMRVVLVALAALCFVLGLFPGLAADPLGLIARSLRPPAADTALLTTATSLTVSVPKTATADSYAASLSMLPVFFLIALPLVLAALVGLRRRRTARGALWTGGTPYDPTAMQISGSAFAFLTWEWASGRGEKTTAAADEPTEYVPWRLPLSRTRYVREYFRYAIDGVVGGLLALAQKFGDAFQGGDIRLYLLYLFVAFVFALIVSILR